ncbi:hypothetical protein FIBSPDRAFT_743483, partial [Athelia psychrophila]
SQKLLTHCSREMLHVQWEILLDNEFIQAYRHRIIVRCCDKVTRRIYARIFTYSADYPEKVLLASICDKGCCPCPRCLVLLTQVERLGTINGMKQRKRLAQIDDK